MSEQLKVLCVRKEHVTAALGGKLEHGAHQFDKELFINSIEPNLEVKTVEELAGVDDYIQLLPFLFFPRTEVTESPLVARTALAVYHAKEPVQGQPSHNAGFACWVGADSICTYAATPAPEGMETIADEREGKIALFQSLQNAVQKTVMTDVAMMERQIEGNPDPEQLVVQDVGYAIVDHRTAETGRFLAVLFMCLLPKQFTAAQNYGDDKFENDGEVLLTDLEKPEIFNKLDGWSAALVTNLIQAEKDFNVSLAAAEPAAIAAARPSMSGPLTDAELAAEDKLLEKIEADFDASEANEAARPAADAAND